MIALVLAAGYATRLYPLTADRPKALLPLGSRTILDLLADKLEELDEITRIIIVSNHKFTGHFQAWADGRTMSKPVSVLDDGTASETERLGAIGDLQLAIERAGIREDLLVLAGDNVCAFSLKGYAEYFRRTGRDCILVRAMDRPEELQRVAVAELDGENRVLRLEEKPAAPRTNIGVYAIYLYRADTLPLVAQYLAEGNPPDAPGHFPEWLCSRKEVRAYEAEGEVYDIGTHEAYREAQERWKTL